MIIVNIRVPALETVYNFSLDESASVSALIEEMVAVIRKKERFEQERDIKKTYAGMSLCCIDTGIQLRPDLSLKDYGIWDGAEFMLV